MTWQNRIGRISLGVVLTAILVDVDANCHGAEAATGRVASPNGKLTAGFDLDAEGAPHYQIQLDGRPVLQESRLGLVRDDADFSKSLRLVSESPVESIADDYEILTAKRRMNSYRANRKVFHLETAAGAEARRRIPSLQRRRGVSLCVSGDRVTSCID